MTKRSIGIILILLVSFVIFPLSAQAVTLPILYDESYGGIWIVGWGVNTTNFTQASNPAHVYNGSNYFEADYSWDSTGGSAGAAALFLFNGCCGWLPEDISPYDYLRFFIKKDAVDGGDTQLLRVNLERNGGNSLSLLVENVNYISGGTIDTTYEEVIMPLADFNFNSYLDVTRGIVFQGQEGGVRALHTYIDYIRVDNAPTVGHVADDVIPSVEISQATDGSGDVTINFKLKDPLPSDPAQVNNTLNTFEYSTDGGGAWGAPTSGDASAALTNFGSNFNSATSFAGATEYSLTLDTKDTVELSGLDGIDQNDVQVRYKATDTAITGDYGTSESFSVDNLNPATLLATSVAARPDAGDSVVTVDASFTENNPNTNNYYAEINGGGYGAAQPGDTGVADPSSENVPVGATLDGNDWVSKVKSEHEDDFGNDGVNETLNPSLRGVKPYTPQAITLNNHTATTIEPTINKHASEVAGLEYAIEATKGVTTSWIQTDGTLGGSEAWNNKATWDTKTITGLSLTDDYTFKAKSRNPNGDNPESDFSVGAQVSNALSTATAPSSISQYTDGSGYVSFRTTIADADNNDTRLKIEYSDDGGTSWYNPQLMSVTPSSGSTDLNNSQAYQVGSTNPIDTSLGNITINGIWDTQSSANGNGSLAGVDSDNIRLRVTPSDILDDGVTQTAANFTVDNLDPTTSASPAAGTYNTSQSVTLSANETATIYYTTNGSTPTASSAQYINPLTISTDTTLKFFSVDSLNNQEAVKTANYVIAAEEDGDGEPIQDDTPPTISNISPAPNSEGAPLDKMISFTLTDKDSGIDIDTLTANVVGSKSGRLSSSNIGGGAAPDDVDIVVAYSGGPESYKVSLVPRNDFQVYELVTVEIDIDNRAANLVPIYNNFLVHPSVAYMAETASAKRLSFEWSFRIAPNDEPTNATSTPPRTRQDEDALAVGANFAIGDLTNDGTKEIVTAPRSGLSYIKVFSKNGHQLTQPFLAYPKSYLGGVNVTVADLDGTGREQEIITSPMQGTFHIRIFNRDGNAISSFFAYGKADVEGVVVKAADLNNDGEVEIITASSHGHIRVFNKDGESLIPGFFAYNKGYQGEIDLEIADINKEVPGQEIITSSANRSSHVRIFDKDGNVLNPGFFVYQPEYTSGADIAVGELDRSENGDLEIVAVPTDKSSYVSIFNKDGKKLTPGFMVYDEQDRYDGGLNVEVADLDGNGGPAEIITVSRKYSTQVRIFNKDGKLLTPGFFAYPENQLIDSNISAQNLDNAGQKREIILSPKEGFTRSVVFDKDSDQLVPGFYLY